MKINTILLVLLISFSILSTYPQQAMLPQNIMMPSEEELIKMTKEIEDFRANMSQEQRDEFDKQVEELSKVMENMSPAELDDFIVKVFNPDGLDNPQPTALPQSVTPPVVTPAKPEEPLYKPSTVSTKTIETTKRMILEVIDQLEKFLRKASLLPDLYGELQTWIPAALLADKKELTWQQLKPDIEQLISSLKIILTTDPKTGHYYYITSLIEQDALYQNIIRLNDTLMRHEPNMEVAPFGLGEVTKESRKATGALLGALVQAIYTQQMISEIKKLFTAFEPQAKKVIEQEETARKRAIEESKRTLMQAPLRSAGTFNEEYTSSVGYTPGLTDSYGQSAYIPAIMPSYNSAETASTEKTGGSTTQKPLPDQTPAEQSAKKEKEDAEKKQKTEAIPDKKVTDSAEKIIEKIEGYLEELIIGLKAKKLTTTAMDKEKAEAVEEAAGKIARIISRIKTLESVLKDVSPAQKNLYIDRIKIMVKDEKDLFDTIISTTPSDNVLRKQIEALFKQLELIPVRKMIKTKPTQTETLPREKPVAKPTIVTTAEVHPASLPAVTEEAVRPQDIHPAALQPVEQ